MTSYKLGNDLQIQQPWCGLFDRTNLTSDWIYSRCDNQVNWYDSGASPIKYIRLKFFLDQRSGTPLLRGLILPQSLAILITFDTCKKTPLAVYKFYKLDKVKYSGHWYSVLCTPRVHDTKRSSNASFVWPIARSVFLSLLPPSLLPLPKDEASDQENTVLVTLAACSSQLSHEKLAGLCLFFLVPRPSHDS